MNDHNTNHATHKQIRVAGFPANDEILINPKIFPYWCPADVAAILCISQSHVNNLIATGDLESFKGVTLRYVYTASMIEYKKRMRSQ